MQPKEPTPREKDKTNEKVQVILRVRPYVESEEPEEFISALEVAWARFRTTQFRSISQDSLRT